MKESIITVMIHANGNFVACEVFPQDGIPFSDWKFENSNRSYRKYETAEKDAIKWAKRTGRKLILGCSPDGMKRNYIMHQENRQRVWKRRREEPVTAVKLEELVSRLTSHLKLYGEELCTVSGGITLHTNYSHVVDVDLCLGEDPRRSGFFKCPRCNCLFRSVVGHLIDPEKFWCKACGRHTEDGYDDEV